MANFKDSVKLLGLLYTTSENEAWQLARGMNDLGYELDVDPEFDVVFYDTSASVVPMTKGGELCWAITSRRTKRVDIVRYVINGSIPTFPTPTAAAVWLQVERSNAPVEAKAFPQGTVPNAAPQVQGQPIDPSNPWGGLPSGVQIGTTQRAPSVPAMNMPAPLGADEYARISKNLAVGKGPFS